VPQDNHRELDHVARIQVEWALERPDLDMSPQGIIGRLHRVAARLTDQLVALYSAYGVSEGEFDVLAALRRAGPPYERPAGELAAHTMITTGGLTKRVDRLVAAGLASRRTDTTDGRGRLIRLTTSGLELIDAAFTAHMTNERRLVDQLTEEERAQLERILTRWLEALEPTP
jgi:DNA-binding MarR family transcriptional regulator